MAYQAGNNGSGNGQRLPLSLSTNQSGFKSQSQRADKRRYSWEDTPIEMQNPAHSSSHQRSRLGDAPIPIPSNKSREQTMLPTTQAQAQTLQQETSQQRSSIRPQETPNPTERRESQPAIPRSGSPYNIPEPAEPHPALFAPIVSPDTDPYNQATYSRPGTHTPSSSPLSHPQKTQPSSDRKPPIPLEQEPVAKKVPPRQGTQIFSPTSLPNPNVAQPSSAPHIPGQVAHPNMNMASPGSKAQWQHKLCECSSDVSTCLLGFTCPCIVYSRTSYRLNAKDAHRDPTDLLGFEKLNPRCLLFTGTVFCGLHCLLPFSSRMRVRHTYNLAGNCAADFVESFYCCCCVVIQNEREVKEREDNIRHHAGPVGAQSQYARVGPMAYTAGGG